MKKVLLLCMPFASLNRPALGISLLKASLELQGIPCDIRYPMFALAESVGCEEYQWLSCDVAFTAWAGEWAFTAALYGPRPQVDAAYVQEILRGIWRLSERDVRRIQRMRSWVPYFLDYCMATIPWEEYAIVGFTSTFEQNISSLALAQRIKSAHPDIAIAFGGANWEGEMGQELHRQFPFVDYVCPGEAERSFPALARHILTGERAAPKSTIPPGVIYRAGGESVFSGAAELIGNLDELPIPDYRDYFAELAQSTVASSIFPVVLLETARGCWWGAKSQCTFCGLNGANLTYRSKSAGRAIEELTGLAERWKTELVEVVDNMLDLKYFDDMLPALARKKWPVRLFYEVKANLSREQVQLLQAARVDHIQPGIESLSDHVLKLMRKGTTALRNIQLLKWCKENHIRADWNILYGFPGETQEDYEAMLELLPSIRFLSLAPTAGPMRVDRFSPYFKAPARFGLTNLRPMAPYKYLYPFARQSLMRIAYCFDYDYEPAVDPRGYARKVADYAADWKCHPETGSLSFVPRPDGSLTLLDTRSIASLSEVTLTGLERAAYEFCDSLHSVGAVARRLHELFPEVEFVDDRLLRFLDSLVANRLMVTDGKHYLSLAIPVEPVRGQPVLHRAAVP